MKTSLEGPCVIKSVRSVAPEKGGRRIAEGEKASNLTVNLRKVEISVCLFPLRRVSHICNPRKLRIVGSKASWGTEQHAVLKREVRLFLVKSKGGKVLENVVLSSRYCVALDPLHNLSRHEFPLL